MNVQKIIDSLNKNYNNFALCFLLKELIDKNNTKEAIKHIQKHFNCSEEIANNVFKEFENQIYSEFKKIEKETGVSVIIE